MTVYSLSTDCASQLDILVGLLSNSENIHLRLIKGKVGMAQTQHRTKRLMLFSVYIFVIGILLFHIHLCLMPLNMILKMSKSNHGDRLKQSNQMGRPAIVS